MAKFYMVPKSQDLMHYGVKGMKWGVRKHMQARKRYAKSDHSNTDKVKKLYTAKIKELNEKHEREVNGDWGSEKARKLDSKQYKERTTLINEGKRKVREAMLLDAGYSREEAKIGATWMMEKGFNISYSDNAWYQKVI